MDYPHKGTLQRLAFFAIGLQLSLVSFGQSRQIYMERAYEWKYQSTLSQKHFQAHDAIKPFLFSEVEKVAGPDSNIHFPNGFPIRSLPDDKDVDKGHLDFYPLLELGLMSESGDTSRVISRLGIGAGAIFELGKKLAVQINVSGHNNQYPSFHDSNIVALRKVPEGMVWHQDRGGYNYVDFNGYASWSPAEFLNFQVGRGNHFFGNGYRSMMVSANAGNYNYARLGVDIWKLKYVVLYNHMNDMNATSSRAASNFRDKYSTMHYLSWNITKWLNVGFFESVVWKASDTLVSRGYDVNYLNPVIFFRPVEFSTGSSDNSIMGLNLSVKPKDGWQVYGQFVIDEFLLDEFVNDIKALTNPDYQGTYGWWANKYAWQLGTKAFNLFGVNGLGIQTEFNLIRPFTFTHKDPWQNYGHQNSPLAHPLGANFTESANFLNYQKGNWFFEATVKWFNQGMSTDSLNAGEDIYRSYDERNTEYGHITGQGQSRRVLTGGVRASYLIMPENNLRFNAGITSRNQAFGDQRNNSLFFHLGISTSFKNQLFDI